MSSQQDAREWNRSGSAARWELGSVVRRGRPIQRRTCLKGQTISVQKRTPASNWAPMSESGVIIFWLCVLLQWLGWSNRVSYLVSVQLASGITSSPTCCLMTWLGIVECGSFAFFSFCLPYSNACLAKRSRALPSPPISYKRSPRSGCGAQIKQARQVARGANLLSAETRVGVRVTRRGMRGGRKGNLLDTLSMNCAITFHLHIISAGLPTEMGDGLEGVGGRGRGKLGLIKNQPHLPPLTMAFVCTSKWNALR